MEIGTISISVGISAIAIAVFNSVISSIMEYKNKKTEKKENIRLLIGEILHIKDHYDLTTVSLREIENPEVNHDKLIKKLRFAKYGQFKAVNNVNQYRFLSAGHIRNFHQLAFRIRNLDTLLDNIMDSSDINQKYKNEIADIEDRIKKVTRNALELLQHIRKIDKEVETIIDDALDPDQDRQKQLS